MITVMILLGMLIQVPMFLQNKAAGNRTGMVVAVICFILLAIGLAGEVVFT